MGQLDPVLHLSGDYLSWSDDYISFLDRAAKVFERSGHVRTQARALYHLGLAFDREHRFYDAADKFEKAAEVLEKVGDLQGRQQAITRLYLVLQKQNNASLWKADVQGEVREALSRLRHGQEQAAVWSTAVYPVRPPRDWWDAEASTGPSLDEQEQQRLDYVIGQLRESRLVLADLATILGPEHPKILSTRRVLAQWRGACGDLAGAISDLANLLADVRRVLGDEHEEAFAVQRSLVMWRQRASVAERSRTEEERAERH